jgi:uncharacterized protein
MVPPSVASSPTTSTDVLPVQGLLVPRPTAPAERMDVLDVLRGLALLGILLGNVHIFSGYYFTSLVAPATTSSADRAVLTLTHLLVDGKFYSIFSLLFGIGFYIFMERAEARGSAAVPLFRRRLRWLLAIGVAHAFLLWSGDILTVYALMGFLLVPFRKVGDRALLGWAAGLLALPVALYGLAWAVGMGDPFAGPPGDAATAVGGFDPIRAIISGYSGGYLEMLRGNAVALVGRWMDLVITVRFPKVLAMFLVGFYVGRAAMPRDPAGARRLLHRVLAAGLVVGLPANAYLAWAADNVPYLPASAPGFLYVLAGAVGIPALALAYAAGVALLVAHPAAGAVLGGVAPVGRMALTNYLLQSFLCGLVFYGWGLGFYGGVGPARAALVACGVFAVQVLLSHLWMRRAAFGPAEWVWRRLTYGRWSPLRRGEIG